MELTSHSNPLRIDSVMIPGRNGEIGMTFCPGKKQIGVMGYHNRDLAADLNAIQAWGAEVLVSLIEEHEYLKAGVGDFEARMPDDVLHLKLPIPDASIPSAAWEHHWETEGSLVRSVLRRGGKICVHCMGGLGRTGMVAARLLVEFGVHPEEAIRMIRTARPGTIETHEQEAYVRTLLPLWERRARFRACLLAGACGDALGASVEFTSLERIRETYGPEGIRDFSPDSTNKPGKITDDTKMTLFTAEGLIGAELRGETGKAKHYERCLLDAYLRWLCTQEENVPVQAEMREGWLFSQPALHFQRAPGTTCLAALKEEAGSVPQPLQTNNMSKDCGGVMRAAPAALHALVREAFSDAARESAFINGIAAAKITHGHPTGYLAAGAFAHMLCSLGLGLSLTESATAAIKRLEQEKNSEETITKLAAAMRLAASAGETIACIEELGQGWVAEEALAIAVFCALRCSSLEEGVIMAVNISGDSDSTGSITGNLLGMIYGIDAIPKRWLNQLELHEVIQTTADDLFELPDALCWRAQGEKIPGYWEQALLQKLLEKGQQWWLTRYPG